MSRVLFLSSGIRIQSCRVLGSIREMVTRSFWSPSFSSPALARYLLRDGVGLQQPSLYETKALNVTSFKYINRNF